MTRQKDYAKIMRIANNAIDGTKDLSLKHQWAKDD